MNIPPPSKVDHWERLKRLEQELMDLRDRNEQLEAKIRLLQDHEKAWNYVTASDLKAIEQRVNREAQQTMQHLMTLQGRIDMLQSLFNELDRKMDYKQPAQQSVADFERSQSLNALSQKPTPADLNAEIHKAFLDWLTPDMASKCRLEAFQAGVKFGQSKPLPNQTL